MSWTTAAAKFSSVSGLTCKTKMGGDLYAGTNQGTLLKLSAGAWTQVASAHAGSRTHVFSLETVSGTIYGTVGTALVGPQDIVTFTGSAWTSVSAVDAKILVKLSTQLFAVGGSTEGSDNGVYRVLPTLSSIVSTAPAANCMCAKEFSALIWVCYDDGTVRTNNGVASSFTTAHTFSGEYATAMCVHGGELYVGTSIGKVYKWNGSAFVHQSAITAFGIPITAMLSFGGTLKICVSNS